MRTGTIAVIGAGIIGRAWAITFARGGHDVRLHDADPDAGRHALAAIGELLPELERFDLLGGQPAPAILARIGTTTDIDAALSGALHVQECTPESIEAKRAIFALLDARAETAAVIASSSSALLPSAFTAPLPGRHRCLVAHPINPPYVVPAVEIVPAPWTDAASVESTRDLMLACGQSPIVMTREAEGFIMNCLQGAVLQEAFRLVAEGYATVEDIDVGIRDGLGLRWSFMGPFETIDLNAPGGIRDYIERYGPAYARIARSQHPVDWTGTLAETIERERRESLPDTALGRRQRWRDERLMALIAHRRAADKDILR